MISVVVAAPPRVVSAGLPGWAPGDEVLGFRVVSSGVDGWSAVAVRGRPLRIEVTLAPVPGGTAVTCTATRGGARVPGLLRALADGVRSRALK